MTAGAADIAQQIRAEIQRVRDLTANVKPDPRLTDIRAEAERRLKGATEDLAAGYFYSSLEKLARASDYAGGIRAIANDAEVVKGGMPAFDIERTKASRIVSQIGPVAPGTPAALRALVDTAR